MPENNQLSVKLPPPLKRNLVKEAQADHRSLTSLIVKILTDREKVQAAE